MVLLVSCLLSSICGDATGLVSASTLQKATLVRRARGIQTIVMPFSSFSNDEGTATQSLDDGSGNNVWTGTVHNDAKLGQGRLRGSKALTFDGVGNSNDESYGQHVSVDGGTTLGGGALTICVHVKYGTFHRYSRIIDFGNGRDSDNIMWYNNPGSSSMVWCGGLTAGEMFEKST